jgi:FemAB-related protein (PEP-CTERM system-associated)
VIPTAGNPHLAHAPEWAAVIQRAYGHEPLYLAARDGGGRTAVLPAFVVRRPFFGTAVTSMPFLDGGGPCSDSPEVAGSLVEMLADEARRLGAAFVELRCSQRLPIAWDPSEQKVNLTLPLPSNPDVLWRELDKSVRNQVRKAERSGLSVDFGGAEYLDAFYATFASRMRELGSPVHNRRFFRAIVDEFGSQVRVGLVRRGGVPVGGLIALSFRETLTVPWASCLSEYRSLCPNMLLYWETIRAACLEGFRRFDFGRSSRGSGTYRFKRQWGAEESPLFWYTIPINARVNESDDGSECAERDRAAGGPGRGLASWVTTAWQHLPLAVTRCVGPQIRRYLIQ